MKRLQDGNDLAYFICRCLLFKEGPRKLAPPLRAAILNGWFPSSLCSVSGNKVKIKS